ncbi:aldehyde ferredoxin oxidoreductase family protein [Candidatus Bathyarchaeota archaeon]|nr:aldehyde ferredoxin oxidoreductase family protein [Candidatus Bathyarchaeota archaeon]
MAVYAWVGKFLKADLTHYKTVVESSEPLVRRFIGGRGVGQWLLFNSLRSGIDPLSPDNIIVFGTGPLTGTMAPASRMSVDLKNVYTNGVLSSSVGGHIGPELKYAGFDFLVLQGASKRPVYLFVNDGRAEFRDASHLWGESTWRTEDILRKELGDPRIRVASIGPAGENLAKPACIIVDKARAAGRGGSGAVMGSKRLKALVVRGTGPVDVAQPNRFMEEVERVWRKLDENQSVSARRKYGTRASLPSANHLGFLGARNFQDDYWDDMKIERVRQEILNERYEKRKLACFNCPLHCSHLYKIDSGPYAGLMCEGFQMNVDWDFSAKLDIDDPEALIKINAVCNELGLDIDNTSAPVAWAFELFEKGIVGSAETDGLELKWGDSKMVIELIWKIARREGFGKILAEGSRRASEIIGRGSERYVSHIKGQDSIEALRSDKGWALGCVVATRGGGHLNGAFQSHRTPHAGNPHSYDLKAEAVFWFEKFKAAVDMLGICYFTTVWSDRGLLDQDDLAQLFSAATGIQVDGEQLINVGLQVHNVEKAFNTLHAGFSRRDDYPPERFMTEPVKSGPNRGEKLDRENWNMMLDQYYTIHGWDPETGWQRSECLDKLGLVEVKQRLRQENKLLC